jgi:hypothetical protein
MMMTPAHTAALLHAAIEEVLPLFHAVDETRTTRRSRPDGWSAREILGHLIDSACNNHRRFVIGQSADTMTLEGYEQNLWVARQHYDSVAWRDLVTLWTAYNRHLAHVMTCVSIGAIDREISGPGGTPVTVRFLMEDYVVHLRHHLQQIRALLEP